MTTDLLTLDETPGAAIACDMTGPSDTAEERIAAYELGVADGPPTVLGRIKAACGC